MLLYRANRKPYWHFLIRRYLMGPTKLSKRFQIYTKNSSLALLIGQKEFLVRNFESNVREMKKKKISK